MKILIVDDSKVARKQIRAACQRSGYRAALEEADGVIMAIRQIKTVEPDLVICDYNMPSISGMRLLKLVRDVHPEVTFAFVSGNMPARDRELAESLGVDFFLGKPLDLDELTRVVEHAHEKVAAVN